MSADTDTEAEAAPETDDVRQGLIDALADALGDGLVESVVKPGRDVWVRVTADAWADAAIACRDRLGLSYFGFLSAIDWMPSPWGRYENAVEDGGEPVIESDDAPADDAPADEAPADEAAPDEGAAEAAPTDDGLKTGVAGGASRFQLLARLFDPARSLGLTLKADLDEAAPSAPSLVKIYGGANWHEREAHEMFGIDFVGHPDLRNIYLPGDFEGYPLRKDFPLLSRMVKPWPGIVDVEPMPAGADDEGEGEEAS